MEYRALPVPGSPSHSIDSESCLREEEEHASLVFDTFSSRSRPRDETLPVTTQPRTLGAHNGTQSSERKFDSSLTKEQHTLGLTITEPALLASSSDWPNRPPGSCRVDKETTAETRDSAGRYKCGHSDSSKGNALMRKPPPLEELGEAEERPFRKGHRRNPAVMHISTSAVTDPLGPSVEQARVSETLASSSADSNPPVCNCSIENLISQLLKSLPPDTALALKHWISTHLELSLRENTVCASRYSMKGSNLRVNGDFVKEQNYDTPGRFKLLAERPSTLASDADDECSAIHAANQTSVGVSRESPTRQKLKVKAPRDHAAVSRFSLDSTELHTDHKHCNTPADSEECARKNTFAKRLLDLFAEPTEIELQMSGVRPGVTSNEPAVVRSSRRSLDQFDIQYPRVTRRSGMELQRTSTSISTKEIPCYSRGLGPGANKDRHYMLRQKLSRLRFRVSGTLDLQPQIDSSILSFGFHGEPLSACNISTVNRGGPIELDEAAGPPSAKAGGRLRRWTKGAKKAIRSCVRQPWRRPSSSRV
jgi:hypothetical protein